MGVAAVFLGVQPASAEEPIEPPITLGATYFMPGEVDAPDGAADEGRPELGGVKAYVAALFPVYREDGQGGGDGLAFVTGLRYSLLRPVTSDVPVEPPSILQEFHLPLMLRVPFSRAWSAIALVSPMLTGELSRVEGDSFRVGGGTVVSYRDSETFALGGGVLATYQFGRLLPLPALQVDWRATDELRVVVAVPRFARAAYRVHPDVELALSTALDGNSFPGEEAVRETRFTQLLVGSSLAYQVTHPLWIRAYFGVSAYRRLQLLDGSGDTLADLDAAPAPVLRLQLEVRPGRSDED